MNLVVCNELLTDGLALVCIQNYFKRKKRSPKKEYKLNNVFENMNNHVFP